MPKKKFILTLSAISLSALSVSAQSAELVTNGGFENTTTAPHANAQNGAGELTWNTNLADWTNDTEPPLNQYGFNILGTASDFTAGVNTEYGANNFQLSNSVTNSPDGGNFLAMVGALQDKDAGISQVLSGLTPNDQVIVTFYVAAAQQVEYLFKDATTEGITVSLGGEKQNYDITGPGSSYSGVGQNGTGTGTYLPAQGFSGWQQVTMSFTPTVSNPSLSFLAYATPFGAPPFVLLDGVSATNVSPVSPTVNTVPFEFSPEQGFLLGVPLFLGLRRLKKRKLVK
jgi:hypothetical protein